MDCSSDEGKVLAFVREEDVLAPLAEGSRDMLLNLLLEGPTNS